MISSLASMNRICKCDVQQIISYTSLGVFTSNVVM
jgi:hypothetical protein